MSEKTRKREVAAAAAAAVPSVKNLKSALQAAPSAGKSTAPAVRVTLRDRAGDELVITLHGTLVIVGAGSGQLVQTLDSEAEAREHFERVVLLRKKSGFVVLRTEECASETLAPPDILETQDFDGTIDFADGRWTLTFRGDPDAEISAEVAGAVVGRLAQAAPRLAHIICDFASPKRAWEQALSDVQLPSIESFVFDTHFQTQTRQAKNSLGDLAAVLRACPNLQRLFATGDLLLSPVTHPALQTLHLLGSPLSQAVVKALGACTFPSLGRLVLSLGAEGGPCDQEALLDSLIALRAPRLGVVHLCGIDDVPGFLGRMAARGIAPAWKALCLIGTSDGAYELEDVRSALSRHAEALRSLETLALLIDDAELAEAQALWPLVRSAESWKQLTLPAVYQRW